MIHAGQIRKGHRCCAAMNVSMIDVIREHTMRCMHRSRVVFLRTRHVRLHSRIRNGEVAGHCGKPDDFARVVDAIGLVERAQRIVDRGEDAYPPRQFEIRRNVGLNSRENANCTPSRG
jgi:hypothetical protein